MTIELESTASCVRAVKIDKAISSITSSIISVCNFDMKFWYSPRKFVTDHFYAHLFTHSKPNTSNKVFVDPRF